MEFHKRLKLLREESKLTQKKLGEQLNYGSSAIANYESSRNEPSIPDLKKIATCFNVSMDYLLGMSEVRNPYTEDQNTPYFDQLRQCYSKIPPTMSEMLVAFAEFLTTYNPDGQAVVYDKQAHKESPLLSVAETPLIYLPSKKYPTKE